MSKQENLIKQLKLLSLDELIKYETAGVSACRVVNAFGILCCLIMLFYPMTFVIIFGILAVGVLANSHVNISNTLIHIRQYINIMKTDK